MFSQKRGGGIQSPFGIFSKKSYFLANLGLPYWKRLVLATPNWQYGGRRSHAVSPSRSYLRVAAVAKVFGPTWVLFCYFVQFSFSNFFITRFLQGLWPLDPCTHQVRTRLGAFSQNRRHIIALFWRKSGVVAVNLGMERTDRKGVLNVLLNVMIVDPPECLFKQQEWYW